MKRSHWPDGTPRLSWAQRRALLGLFFVLCVLPFLAGVAVTLAVMSVVQRWGGAA